MKKLLIFPLLFNLSAQAWKKSEIYVRTTQEEVDGQVFCHEAKVAEGAVQDLWTINGKQVTQDDYAAKYLQARDTELRAELKIAQEQERMKELEVAKQQQFARNARVQIHKRALAEQITGIEKELARVKDPRLEPYYVFDASAFETPDAFTQLASNLLTQAKTLVARSEEELTEAELLAMATQLEPQPLRLRDFYRVTVKHAINSCDDTRMLKEFLELVA